MWLREKSQFSDGNCVWVDNKKADVAQISPDISQKSSCGSVQVRLFWYVECVHASEMRPYDTNDSLAQTLLVFPASVEVSVASRFHCDRCFGFDVSDRGAHQSHAAPDEQGE
jgi:hypothetical protein